MVNLDALYQTWWTSESVDEQLASHVALLEGVRVYAKRVLRDEDGASDVMLFVLERLDSFVRTSEDAFARWVGTIVRRTRAAGFKAVTTQAARYLDVDPDVVAVSDGDSFLNLNELPDDLKRVAELMLAGYSQTEAASMLGTTSNAIRKKFWRFRGTKVPS